MDHYDPASLHQHLVQNEAQALDYVAQNVFKLTPEEIEALETDVVGTVPKLLAKAFVKSQQNVLAQLGRMVPVMIQRQTMAVQRNSENEQKFYARWANLNKGQHNDLVSRYAVVYRQMHPQATIEQMIEEVGPMVMMAARVPPQPAAVAPSGVPVNPLATAQPQPSQGNGRSPPPNPFVPAGAGPVNASTVPELTAIEAMFAPRDT